jgi:hypothetical protein
MIELVLSFSVLVLTLFLLFREEFPTVPGNLGLPFFGNIIAASEYVKRDAIDAFMADLKQKYGRIFKIRIFGKFLVNLG